jgi:hypothetical protein
LRRALLLVVAVLLVISMVLVNAGVLSGWWLLLNALVVAAALVFERRGYQPRAPDPSALRPTGERFHDPASGALVEVWEDPRDGAREYRPAASTDRA